MKDIKRVGLWGRLVGSVLVVYGGILVIQGIFIYVAAAVPGVITIMMGRYIHESGKEAQEILRSNGKNIGAVDYLLKNLSLFLLLTGILMLLAIILYSSYFIMALFYQ